VVGRFNDTIYSIQSAITASSALFIVGNGTTTARNNALVVLNNGRTGIETSAPSSTLDVDGSFGLKAQSVGGAAGVVMSESYSVVWLSTTGQATLPLASTCKNRLYILCNPKATASSFFSSPVYYTLAGTTSSSIPANKSIGIISDGTNWLQIF
jgi:hypothetical protein